MQQKVKLPDQLRAVAGMRHLSYPTEDASHDFIKRFILFHQKRHPKEMGADEVTATKRHANDTNLYARFAKQIGSQKPARLLISSK